MLDLALLVFPFAAPAGIILIGLGLMRINN
jgi:hypothetical protein